MSRVTLAASIALLLGMAFPAAAHFGISYRPRVTTAYYFAVPVAVVAVPVPAVCLPLPYENPPRVYAQPQLAPASLRGEPPLADPSKDAPPPKPPASPEPEKREARSSNYFDTYAVASGGGAQPGGGRCSVSFWNLAPHDLVLKVGERRVNLATGRSLTLDLDRQFTWQIEGRDPQNAQVAIKDSAMEIVIRR